MHSPLRSISKPLPVEPDLLVKIAQALKGSGLQELACVDLARVDAQTVFSLFSSTGRLANLNICGVGDSNQKVQLLEEHEPLRFVIEREALDPVPDGKVVAISSSVRDRGGRVHALIFARENDGLTFQENRFLATA